MNMLEDQLRETFERRSADVGEPGDLYGDVISRHRRGRRAQALSAAAVVAAGLLVGVPLTQSTFDVGSVAGPGTSYPHPPRGSLAGNAEFLAAVVAAPWGSPDQGPPLRTRQVVFAGDVPGGRWARVVGVDDATVVGIWLAGAPGADGGSLSPITGHNPVEPGPDVVSYFADRQQTLVVVGEPGDEVLVSRQAEITAAGTVQRHYAPVPTVDGVAVVDLGETYLPALSVRVDRAGRTVYRGGGDGGAMYEPADDPTSWSDADIAAASSHRPGRPMNPDLARALLRPLTEDAGYRADELQLSILLAGSVESDAADPVHIETGMITARLPSGAMVVIGGRIAFDDPGLTRTVDLLAIYPAGTDSDSLLLVMKDLEDLDRTPGEAYTLYGPVGTDTFHVLGPSVDVTTERALGRRVTVAAPPDQHLTRVEAVNADGVVLAESGVTGIIDISDQGNGVID